MEYGPMTKVLFLSTGAVQISLEGILTAIARSFLKTEIKINLPVAKKISSFNAGIFIAVFMRRNKSKNKANKKETTLKELIKKSKTIRNNIDTIMSAFKRIE